MSRTKHGAKPPGYDYWSKRPVKGGNSTMSAGYGPEVKRQTHRAERRVAGRALRKEDL